MMMESLEESRAGAGIAERNRLEGWRPGLEAGARDRSGPRFTRRRGGDRTAGVCDRDGLRLGTGVFVPPLADDADLLVELRAAGAGVVGHPAGLVIRRGMEPSVYHRLSWNAEQVKQPREEQRHRAYAGDPG
jgi:hypothetical protein